MHIHAQSTVELDRNVVLVLSGYDQHVAITTSITTSSPRFIMVDAIEMTVLIMFVWSYRDNGTRLGISLRRPRTVSS